MLQNNPLGENSIFNVVTDLTNDTNTPIPIDEGYTYFIKTFNSGAAVIEAFQDTAQPVGDKVIYIYIETNTSSQSNLFGTVYRVKMGVSRKLFMKRLYENKAFVKVDNLLKQAENLYTWATHIAETNSNLNIDRNLLYGAVLLEIKYENSYADLIKSALGINNFIANSINELVNYIETKKLTSQNYDFLSCGENEFKPIIPIYLQYNGNKKLQGEQNVASIAQLISHLSPLAFAAAFSRDTSTKLDDASLMLAVAMANNLQENDFFKTIITPYFALLQNTVDYLVKSLKQIEDVVGEKLAQEYSLILNAFWCGVINGLLSTIQSILTIISFLINDMPGSINSTQDFVKRLEQMEDTIDFVNKNFEKLIQVFVALQNPFWLLEGLYKATNKLWAKYSDETTYFWAYVAGAILFEVIAELLIAFFTGGAAAVAKVVKSYTNFFTTVGKAIGKTAKQGYKAVKNIFEWLQAQLDELFEAIKNNNLGEWLNKKLDEFFGEEKVDDVFNINTILSVVLEGFKKSGIEIISKGEIFILKWKDSLIFRGDFEEVNTLWNKILRPRIGTGSGGILKYIEIVSRNMIAQEQNMSCAAACIRQLAKENGIEITEEAVRKLAGTSEDFGTTDLGLELALIDIFKGKKIEAVTYVRNSDELMSKIITDISKDGSWITNIHPFGGKKHSIIVEKVVNNKVFIKDPWPIEGIGKGNGVECIVDLEEFSKVWLRGGANKFKII